MAHTETPPKVIVHAMIPESPDNSDQAVVTWRGTLPSVEHTERSGTYEDTLNRIGQSALGVSFLSINARNFGFERELQDGDNHHIVYTSKLSSKDVKLSASQRIDFPHAKQQNALAAAVRHLVFKSRELAINNYYDATIYGNYIPRQ